MSRRSVAARLVRRPLVHFLLIGAAVFGVYTLRNGGDAGARRIEVDAGEVRWLAGTFETQFGHRPTRLELRNTVRAFADEELRYREALALGLDRDDSIVRRRLIQKYDFASLDTPPGIPSDAALRAYMAARPAVYASPPRLSFCQLYVAATPTRAAGLARARRLLAALPPTTDAVGGDAIDLPRCLDRADHDAVRRDFGGVFAASLRRVPAGRWVGPVESGYGFHLVHVGARAPGALLDFANVRARVLADWTQAARTQLRTANLAALRAQYAVSIDEAAIDSAAAPPR